MESPFIIQTKAWIHDFVIAHQLCPFARRVWLEDRIRYQLYEGDQLKALKACLREELLLMENSDASIFDTTIIVHPKLLMNFLDYLDFIKIGEDLIVELGLEGEIQLASFHPDYQFAGTQNHAAENYTNRSPYPMLHLLREESIEKAIQHFPNPASIPEKNIAQMNQMGAQQLKKIFNDFKK